MLNEDLIQTEHPQLSTIEEVLADYADGKMVVLVDDEDRENEGDLLIAAECITAEHINFMAGHGRGLICLTLTEQRCQQLELPLMVQHNNARYSTNFTVSIEAAEGVTTGISASDRATTVLAAVNNHAKPSDLATPGHIFPVMAQAGGVLTRAGHTEAGVDMARLAGFEPASVICEILNADGNMARLPDLLEFGRVHGLRIGTIADLIKHRLAQEPTVNRVSENQLATEFGDFQAVVYEDVVAEEVHLALVKGRIDAKSPTLVRVHVNHGLLDMLSGLRDTGSWTLPESLQAVAGSASGVVVLVGYGEDAASLADRIYRLHNNANEAHDDNNDLRMLGAGGQILADLGVGNMCVLGSPKRIHGLSGFGLTISEYIQSPNDLV